MKHPYHPKPADTSDIVLPEELGPLTEKLAENVHEIWSSRRIAEGWQYGDERNDAERTTPCLVNYTDLPETEKDYDRATATETLKLILKLGYRIERNET